MRHEEIKLIAWMEQLLTGVISVANKLTKNASDLVTGRCREKSRTMMYDPLIRISDGSTLNSAVP